MTTPLSNLTDEEAYQCFEIAFAGNELTYKLKGINQEENSIEVYAYANGTVDRIDITVWDNGRMAATGYMENQRMYSPLFDAVKLVDYLRSIGISF